MTGKQTAVLWSGLILIIVRLFTTGQWSALWKTVSNAPQNNVGAAGKILLQDPLLFPPSTPQGGGGGGGAHPIST